MVKSKNDNNQSPLLDTMEKLGQSKKRELAKKGIDFKLLCLVLSYC